MILLAECSIPHVSPSSVWSDDRGTIGVSSYHTEIGWKQLCVSKVFQCAVHHSLEITAGSTAFYVGSTGAYVIHSGGGKTNCL